MKKFIALVVIIGSFAMSFTSCQPIQGSHLDSRHLNIPYEITDSTPLFCSEDAEMFYGTKVLFIVDQTHSNKNSDPNKTMRKQSIRNFIEQNRGNSISYGILSFSNQVFSPITLNGNNIEDDTVAFTSSSEIIETSLDKTFERPDRGRGNYAKVLDEVLYKMTNALDLDLRVNPNKIIDYHIVFISDGNLSVHEDGQRHFVNGVKDIVHRFKRVYVHSVYYGGYKDRGPGLAHRVGQGINTAFQLHMFASTGFFPFYRQPYPENPSLSTQETDDVSHLREVAKKGQGYYVDQNESAGLTLDLSQKWDADPFVVYNLNAGFCLNGAIGLDSDMDGLCDEDEENMPGFEPHKRFSFKDGYEGYGDYFHWLAFEQQLISLTPCSSQEDTDHDLLTDCEEEYINSIESDFPLLSVNNPDSDGDKILDGIEVLVYLSKDRLASRNPYNLDQKSEGLSDYDKILKHISPFLPVEDQIAYDTLLIPVEGESGSCYSLRQTKMPLYSTLPVGEDDTISQTAQKPGDNTLLIYTLRQKRDSETQVYQFMYRTVHVDSGKLNLPVGGNSFRYLAFTNSSKN
ncbi:MAG: hypothetical protein OXK80_06810 [Bdellovibrionales bacterium]|nr:hypothetical protein [Bdellovibrionales bacterium]